MVLLRKVIGDVLRARRLAQRRTLREVSTAANVSLGYLSEIERGHKEASSELLGAICEALGAGLSDVLSDVAATFALAEQLSADVIPDTATAMTAPAAALMPANAPLAPATQPLAPATQPLVPATVPAAGPVEGGEPESWADGVTEVTEGDITVRVRSDGPLRTTLTASRTPGPRQTESLFVG